MTDLKVTRYALALTLVLLAFGLTMVLKQFEAGRPTLFLFFAAIVAAAWFGGVGPGCVAAAASLPCGFYFYHLALPSTSITLNNVVLFFFFLICAMAGGFLSSRQRNAENGLQRAHRQLETKAAELLTANVALRDEMAERRRAELALADTRTKLAHAARLTALGELTATIAHEINQPLAAVTTNASCCLRLLEPAHFDVDEAREAAASIVQDADRASEVIKRIRAMVRRTPPERIAIDVNALAADVLALLDTELRRTGVEVRTAFAPRLPDIFGDRVQLQQVLLNVTMNAMEAMADIAGPRRIEIDTSRTGSDTVEVTVRDTGVGFDGRAPDTFFDAFVTSKADGMGLGLSICRSIVEAHGGHMHAARNEPRGAVLRIVLPVEATP